MTTTQLLKILPLPNSPTVTLHPTVILHTTEDLHPSDYTQPTEKLQPLNPSESILTAALHDYQP